MQSDNEIIIPQDDLYTISWEAEFDEIFQPRRDDGPNETAPRVNESTSNVAGRDVTKENER